MLPSTSSAKIGVYWDFENIHGSLFNVERPTEKYDPFGQQPKLVKVKVIMDYIASIGDVVINRAYANWPPFAFYKDDLNEYSIDLIQLSTKGRNAKNGADIRLALDAFDDIIQRSFLTHIVVISGDSDFISLGQKVKQANRIIIGIGVKESTNYFWMRSCNEFKYYKELLQVTVSNNPLKLSKPTELITSSKRDVKTNKANLPAITDPIKSSSQITPKEQALDDSIPEFTLDDAGQLMVHAIRLLISQKGEDTIKKSSLKTTMKRMYSSFNENTFGYHSFNEFVNAFPNLVENYNDDSGGYVKLKQTN